MKKYQALFLAVLTSVAVGAASFRVSAYTEEEKAYVKSMLSAYGYSPDMAGAQQAYQDYLAGKYNDICEQYGLPKQNVGTKESSSPTDETEGGNEEEGLKNSQTADDNRIHFNQPRVREGVWEVTLVEIWSDPKIVPPAVSGKETGIGTETEEETYLDLVFSVENFSKESLDVEEILNVTLSDRKEEFQDHVLLMETEGGSRFQEETVIESGKKAWIHYGIRVPSDSESFVGNVRLEDHAYELYFDTATRPKDRKTLESGQSVRAEQYGELTCGVFQMNESDNGTEVSLQIKLTNLQKETKEVGDFVGFLAASGEQLFRGGLSSESLGEKETKEALFTVTLPKENEGKETEYFLYFDGVWYQIDV
jgi:hypothetical protein